MTASLSKPRILIVSPARNEARTIAQTIACMEAQTLAPAQWIVVDDGSTDAMPAILERARARIPWLKVVQRQDRGFRKLGGGVIEAFNDGLAAADCAYDYVAKMDVDLEFSPRYLETILCHFANDPQLAAASGKVYRRENGRLVEEFMIDEMVAGQFKLYRRSCFEKIGGFVAEVMWDGIDFHKARIAGFRTASLHDTELRILHLRLMGSSDQNIYRGRLRWGRGQWFMGSCFPYLLASACFRMREAPQIVGGLLILVGYLQAALAQQPRFAEPGFREHLHRWQYRRLRDLVRGKGPR